MPRSANGCSGISTGLRREIYRSRVFRVGFRQAGDSVKAFYANEGQAALAVPDAGLGKGDWLVDALTTIADIKLYGVVYEAAEGGFDPGAYPNISSWKPRLEALPRFASPEQLLPRTPKAA